MGHLRSPDKDTAKQALIDMRAGNPIRDVDDGMGQMILVALMGRELQETTHAVDISFRWETPAGSRSNQYRFLDGPASKFQLANVEKWLEERKHILASNEIAVSLEGCDRWAPSEEVIRLGYISSEKMPDVFGPEPVHAAVDKFAEGKIQETIEIFTQLLKDRDDPLVRNNKRCQIIIGDIAGALASATKASERKYVPLFELNKHIATYLIGDVPSAKSGFHEVLRVLREAKDNSSRMLCSFL